MSYQRIHALTNSEYTSWWRCRSPLFSRIFADSQTRLVHMLNADADLNFQVLLPSGIVVFRQEHVCNSGNTFSTQTIYIEGKFALNPLLAVWCLIRVRHVYSVNFVETSFWIGKRCSGPSQEQGGSVVMMLLGFCIGWMPSHLVQYIQHPGVASVIQRLGSLRCGLCVSLFCITSLGLSTRTACIEAVQRIVFSCQRGCNNIQACFDKFPDSSPPAWAVIEQSFPIHVSASCKHLSPPHGPRKAGSGVAANPPIRQRPEPICWQRGKAIWI